MAKYEVTVKFIGRQRSERVSQAYYDLVKGVVIDTNERDPNLIHALR
jgi:hypothetical protein